MVLQHNNIDATAQRSKEIKILITKICQEYTFLKEIVIIYLY